MRLRTIHQLGVAIGIIGVAPFMALCQHASAPSPSAISPPWAVTVIHRIDLAKLVKRLEKEQNIRVGMIGSLADDPLNITTGLIIDDAGHVLTRLGNLDPRDKDADITVAARDGVRHPATLIGIDGASGFAVLQVDSLKGIDGPSVTLVPSAGTTVRIVTADVHPEMGSTTGQISIFSTFRNESVKLESGFYAPMRGALTLSSPDLGLRSDSGIITTSDYKVIGVAEVASVTPGKAYMFPFELLRDSIAKRVLERNDSVPAGWLGVSGVTAAQLPESERALLGSPTGVVVRDIAPNSAADNAGIHADDVIVGIDGFTIAGTAEMSAVLSGCPAGEKLQVHEIRQGNPLELDVVLGAREIATAAANGSTSAMAAGDGNIHSQSNSLFADFPGSTEEAISAGFTARDLTKQLARYFGADGGTIVTSVVKGSAADQAGLAAGDVIVSGRMAGSPQESPLTARQLKSLVTAGGGPVSLKVLRKKASLSILIRAGAVGP